MFVFLTAALAIFLDRLLGEPAIYHPLKGFAHLAISLEDNWHGHPRTTFQPPQAKPNPNPNNEAETKPEIDAKAIDTVEKIKGVLAVLFLVLPFVALVGILSKSLVGPLNFIFDILVLYFIIGANNIKQHAFNVYNALVVENIETAKKEVSLIVNYETNNMSREDVISACLEAILIRGNDVILAPLFWFLVFGAPGAVLYKLVNVLNTLWGYRSVRYKNFGWAATKLYDVLNWIPARLTALTYLALGDIKNGWKSFNEQAKTWNSPNDELVVATGAGSLSLEITGDVYCHGELKKRGKLGSGRPAILSDIPRSSDLIERSMIIWLAFILVLSLLEHWQRSM